jgi:hypothetical protein
MTKFCQTYLKFLILIQVTTPTSSLPPSEGEGEGGGDINFNSKVLEDKFSEFTQQ